MGIIDKLLKFTPFYKNYQQYKKKQAEQAKLQLEERLMPLQAAFYGQFIHKGDLVFDVGANVGNRINAFLQNGATVIAVEPQPNCIQTLEEKFGDKITIERTGLAENEGMLEMQIATDSTVSSFSREFINSTKDRFRYSKWEETIQVPITTLDNLIKKHGKPQFIKIDVEGFEVEVLKGLHQHIPYISVEYCVPELLHLAVDCVRMLDKLKPGGQFNYSIEESMVWALENWMDGETFLVHIQSKAFTDTLFGDIYYKGI